jgi:hypothetical protein
MSGDGGCAPLVVSISPKLVRESKSDLTLQSENPKKTTIPLYNSHFLQKKRRSGSNTALRRKS